MTRYSMAGPKRSQRLGRGFFRFILLLIILSVAIGVIWLLFGWLAGHDRSKVVETKPQKAYVSDHTQTFTTDYFSFRAPDTWKLISENSTDKKFYYGNFNNSIVQETFEVYVDDLPTQRASTYAVVVDNTGSELTQAKLSDHCKTYLPAGSDRSQREVSFESAKFFCRPDSTVADVAVAVRGGDQTIKLTRSDGLSYQVAIYFRDSKFEPSLSDISDLVQSFQPI